MNPLELPPGLSGSRPIALFLDFDGVIVDSVGIKIDAFLRIYENEDPAKLKAIREHQHLHGGVTRRVKFRHFETQLFGRAAGNEAVERLSAAYTQLVHDAVLACPFLPGATTFLDRVLGQADMHLVSGTPLEELTDIAERRGLSRYFSSLHGAPATKLRAFTDILEARGYAPNRVLAIGDAITECEAAATLGVPFLGVKAGDDLTTFPADVPCVASLQGLGEALGFA